jgi:hypothetical protein
MRTLLHCLLYDMIGSMNRVGIISSRDALEERELDSDEIHYC